MFFFSITMLKQNIIFQINKVYEVLSQERKSVTRFLVVRSNIMYNAKRLQHIFVRVVEKLNKCILIIEKLGARTR